MTRPFLAPAKKSQRSATAAAADPAEPAADQEKPREIIPPMQ